MPPQPGAAASGDGTEKAAGRLPQPPGNFQLNEDYDNNFYVFVGLLHRLRAKYEYVKRGYERKNLPPGRSLKHLVSIIESFIDLASNSIAAPAQYEGQVAPGDVPVPDAARTDHVMRRRMVLIEDDGQLFALDPAVIVGGELCMCGRSRRPVKPMPHMDQPPPSNCEHCNFEKANLLQITRDLSRVAGKRLSLRQQSSQPGAPPKEAAEEEKEESRE